MHRLALPPTLLMIGGCGCFMENNAGGTISRGIEFCYDSAVDRAIQNKIDAANEDNSEAATLLSQPET